jgi:hypothetical protein
MVFHVFRALFRVGAAKKTQKNPSIFASRVTKRTFVFVVFSKVQVPGSCRPSSQSWCVIFACLLGVGQYSWRGAGANFRPKLFKPGLVWGGKFDSFLLLKRNINGHSSLMGGFPGGLGSIHQGQHDSLSAQNETNHEETAR